MKKKTFLEIQQDKMEVLGFWDETYRSVLINNIELMYKPEIIKEWSISDVVINGDKVLLKWNKRMIPLTEEELNRKYGK